MSTIEITHSNLEATITAGGIVVLDFWAAWCGPCVVFSPVFAEVASEFPEVTFGTIDTDDQQDLAAMFGITSLPTLMVIRDGVHVFAQSGPLPAAALRKLVRTVQGLDMREVRARLAQEAPSPPAA